jgi:NO-binding membrane sensor protein with MHYT domain
MVRRSSFIIGLGLALLWWIGLSLNPNATLLWFDAVGAVLAFAIGGLVDDTIERDPAHAFGPAVLGLGLAAVWIIGMASSQPRWAAWFNFVFAVASLAVAVRAAAAGRRYVVARRA